MPGVTGLTASCEKLQMLRPCGWSLRLQTPQLDLQESGEFRDVTPLGQESPALLSISFLSLEQGLACLVPREHDE